MRSACARSDTSHGIPPQDDDELEVRSRTRDITPTFACGGWSGSAVGASEFLSDPKLNHLFMPGEGVSTDGSPGGPWSDVAAARIKRI
jgi:hypothetical protein